MAGIVRWFKSGGAVLTKFTPLKSRDEGEDNREMATQPRSPEGNLDGIQKFCTIFRSYKSGFVYFNNIYLLKMNV